MGERVKKLGKQVIACLLVAVLGVVTFTTANVQAATNKALCFNYSFNGQNYEKNEEECSYNNNYGVWLYGTNKKTAIKKIKLSADIYIPKTALKKKGAVIDVTPYLDLMGTKGEYVGEVVGRISLSAVNENGKIKLYAWDEVAQKNVKAATYGSCKAGTGTYKSFYVLKIKNVPVADKMMLENGETQALKASKKYGFNLGVSITGENNKGTGKIYVDNVKAAEGSKTVVSHDFSKTPKYYGVYNRGKDLPKSKVKIVKF